MIYWWRQPATQLIRAGCRLLWHTTSVIKPTMPSVSLRTVLGLLLPYLRLVKCRTNRFLAACQLLSVQYHFHPSKQFCKRHVTWFWPTLSAYFISSHDIYSNMLYQFRLLVHCTTTCIDFWFRKSSTDVNHNTVTAGQCHLWRLSCG